MADLAGRHNSGAHRSDYAAGHRMRARRRLRGGSRYKCPLLADSGHRGTSAFEKEKARRFAGPCSGRAIGSTGTPSQSLKSVGGANVRGLLPLWAGSDVKTNSLTFL